MDVKLFLNEFTEELILSSAKPIMIQKIEPVLPYLQQPVEFRKFIKEPEVKSVEFQIQKPMQKFNLPAGQDKIDFLLRNPRVTALECPGPGKFIIIRKGFRTELTRISLTEQEIKKKIEEFSQQTKIPLIGGLFKATIGNLTMSAVLSDYAGSRFILSKFMPTNISNPPQLPMSGFSNPILQKFK